MPTLFSLSVKESYLLTGVLSPDQLETLFDAEEDAVTLHNRLCDVARNLYDANCFPKSDFLQSVIDRLAALEKNVRGANNARVLAVIAALVRIQADVGSESEEGRANLNAVIKLAEAPLE